MVETGKTREEGRNSDEHVTVDGASARSRMRELNLVNNSVQTLFLTGENGTDRTESVLQGCSCRCWRYRVK